MRGGVVGLGQEGEWTPSLRPPRGGEVRARPVPAVTQRGGKLSIPIWDLTGTAQISGVRLRGDLDADSGR